mmetsp:Transcript_58471/g.187815  ORF Transcript_58471/g.187815 Transcript_58471/m.187815 type:complete len:253 (+) Transcript_58471:113-871(+)
MASTSSLCGASSCGTSSRTQMLMPTVSRACSSTLRPSSSTARAARSWARKLSSHMSSRNSRRPISRWPQTATTVSRSTMFLSLASRPWSRPPAISSGVTYSRPSAPAMSLNILSRRFASCASTTRGVGCLIFSSSRSKTHVSIVTMWPRPTPGQIHSKSWLRCTPKRQRAGPSRRRRQSRRARFSAAQTDFRRKSPAKSSLLCAQARSAGQLTAARPCGEQPSPEPSQSLASQRRSPSLEEPGSAAGSRSAR